MQQFWIRGAPWPFMVLCDRKMVIALVEVPCRADCRWLSYQVRSTTAMCSPLEVVAVTARPAGAVKFRGAITLGLPSSTWYFELIWLKNSARWIASTYCVLPLVKFAFLNRGEFTVAATTSVPFH